MNEKDWVATLDQISVKTFDWRCKSIYCDDTYEDKAVQNLAINLFGKNYLKTFGPKWQNLTVNKIYTVVMVEKWTVGFDKASVFQLDNLQRIVAPIELAKCFTINSCPFYLKPKGLVHDNTYAFDVATGVLNV